MINKFRPTQVLYLMAIVFIASCARMSSPAGGPKDTDAPIPLQSKPINYSTNFKDGKIVILFDEYIELKNIRTELLISPPLPEKPDVKQRGKNLVIKLNNELEDSTTYSLNFYNAIQDLNEGNPLKNFTFEFSTGPEFDSLYLGGFIKNAYDYTSEAGLFIGLYENLDDSTPRKVIPKYVAKSDAEGNYFVTNLKNKAYYVFGLKDFNNNLMFDLPNEGIAFSDSPFTPSFELVELVDTVIFVESISDNKQDTVWADSVHIHQEWLTTLDGINLLYFYEDYELQYFREEYRTEQKQVIFSFNRELSDSFNIKPIVEFDFNKDWYVPEPQKKNDSLVLWLTDSTLYLIDSLHFELSYTMLDSNSLPFTKIDTIVSYFETVLDEVEPTKQEERKGRRQNLLNINNLLGKAEEEVEEDTIMLSELTFTHNLSQQFDLDKPIDLYARFPISEVMPNRISLHKIEDDTVLIPVNFVFEKDTLQLKHYTMSFEKDEDEIFQLTMPGETFSDIYGNVNDTLIEKLRTLSLSNYATLKLHIEKLQDVAIIQFMDAKENIINERKIWSDTTLIYEYIKPQKVIIKLFSDSNGNGKWDTGNFKERKQPEAVFYFPQEVELIQNMDYEYSWDLYPLVEEEPHMHEH